MRRHEIHADVLAAVILCRDRPAARERRGDRRTARPEPADILDHDNDKEKIVLVVAVMQMELDPTAAKFRRIQDILPCAFSLRDRAVAIDRIRRFSIDHIEGLLQPRQRALRSSIFIKMKADLIAVHHAQLLCAALSALRSAAVNFNDPVGAVPALRQRGGQKAQQQNDAQQQTNDSLHDPFSFVFFENSVSQSEPFLLCRLLNIASLFFPQINFLLHGGLDRLPGDLRAGQHDPVARARGRRLRLHLACPDAEAPARQLHG